MLGAGLLVVLGVVGAARAQLPDVLKDVTLGFGQALEQCRQQSELTEDMMQEFFHFWSEGFKFEHRELGCAIHCMGQHYNLLTDSSRMHQDNTHAFITSFPNGETLAHHMTELIHSCEQQHDATEDHCWRVLRTAECFKRECVRAGLAPSVELIIAEIIMEAEP